MTSISKVPSGALTSVSGQAVQSVQTPKVDSTPAQSVSNAGAQSGQSVEISAQAQQLSKWDSLSKPEQRALYDATMDAFVALFHNSAAQGQTALQGMPDGDDPGRIELAKRAAAYVASIRSSPPGQAPNPFAGVDREQLTSVIYDDSGTYTVSERYAAWAEQQRQDYTSLSKLFAGVTNGGDNRLVYKGLLDYFDALSPIERSIYPDDYRDKLADLLEAQEVQFGTLDASAPSDSAAAPAGTALKPGEPIVTQLVALVSPSS
jgi:hypothetical protein